MKTKEEVEVNCMDCNKPYNTFGLDAVLPRSQWLEIIPDEGGILCANCIIDRASKLGGATVVHMIIEISPISRRRINLTAT